jgi:hypothetical protein
VKAIKMIGLAALMALMAMAFVGATSAIAAETSLCTVDETPCAAANQKSSVTETSVGKAVLLTSVGNTECNVTYEGSMSKNKEGKFITLAPSLTLIGGFTYKNCVLGGSSCTATEENGPTTIKVENISTETLKETTKVTGEGLVHVVCSGFIDCSYNGTGLVGTGKGALVSTQVNGEVTLKEQSTTKETGGFLCPKTAKLDITTTSSSKTYITT